MRRPVLLGLVLCGAVASASGETRPRYGRTLKATLLGQPVKVDPHAAASHAEMALADMVFDSLYRINRDGEIVPELAVGMPEVGADKLSVKICVRVGASFHDGSKLTVADAVLSLKRLSARSAGWMLASVSTFEAGRGDDEGCLLLGLRYPEPELTRYLASPVAAITRRGREPRGSRPVGTGPFRVRRIDPARGQIRLAQFAKHHRGRPYLDGIALRWFKAPDEEARAYEVGDIHVSARGAVAFSGHVPKYETSSAAGPATIMAYVGFCRSRRLLSNTSFRRAVSLAIRRAGMRVLGTGEAVAPAISPVSRALGGRAPSSVALSSRMNKARGELNRAAAAVPDLADLSKLKLEILVDRSRLDDRDIADKVLVALHKLGINTSVREERPTKFRNLVDSGACDLYIGQLVAPAATRDAQLAAAFAAGGDSWARTALSRGPLDRASAESEFRRRLPIIPLFHRAVRVHHRNDVLGLRFDGSSQIEWADLFLFGRAKKN